MAKKIKRALFFDLIAFHANSISFEFYIQWLAFICMLSLECSEKRAYEPHN